MYKVSLFASSNRPKLWPSYFKSLEGTLEGFDVEVVFAGPRESGLDIPDLPLGVEFVFIETANLKPSQCYHIASKHCTGETISWSCDDADYSNDVLGKAYRYWKSKENEKLILSIQTKESGENTPVPTLFNMNEHRFFSWVPDSPLMAPMNLMSRKYFNDLGGYDRRYISGQTENDLVMRAYQNGAKVEIFGGADCYIEIDHLRKSIEIGESTSDKDFVKRPFALGYPKDREVLETSWTTFDQNDVFKILHSGERPLTLRKISPVQLDKPEFYEDTDILTKSQSNNLTDRWV
jgi:hypothetical protein